MSSPDPAVNGKLYPTQDIRDYDPVNMPGLTEAQGRIGLTAWAIFRRGTGLVLSFEALNGNRTVIPVDSAAESAGLEELISALLFAVDPGAADTSDVEG